MKEIVMLCHKGEWGQFPEFPDAMFEPKLDGVRCITAKVGDTVKMMSRHKTDFTEKFPEIVADLVAFPHDFIIDGEIVGKDYSTLSGRTHLEDKFKIEMRSKVEPCDYYVFDILALDGAKMIDFPLVDRKDTLADLFEGRYGVRPRIRLVRPQRLNDLLDQVNEKKLEGVVAKDPNSRYEFRRSPSWTKFRPETTEDLLILGYEDSDKPTRPYRSLIMRRGEKEVQASSGLSYKDLDLTKQIFDKEPKRQSGTKWYFDKPRFYAEVSFYSGSSEIPYRFPKVVKLKFENSECRVEG